MSSSKQPIQNHDDTNYAATNQPTTPKCGLARCTRNPECLPENDGQHAENSRTEDNNHNEASYADLCHEILAMCDQA